MEGSKFWKIKTREGLIKYLKHNKENIRLLNGLPFKEDQFETSKNIINYYDFDSNEIYEIHPPFLIINK